MTLVNENLPETIEEDHAHARLKSTSALEHIKLLQATWPSVFSSTSPLTRQTGKFDAFPVKHCVNQGIFAVSLESSVAFLFYLKKL